ncbi:hypothetical protein EVAR_48437_1 [Eumeta japonica]|uniref:Uncharacterized protein n=1 Tax=Eumeta variegata TaxID=151549 RepID=A0A4C1XT68_EUMVA|nr:hypothetical protein EVAR_48437_1 [Eumeta japonica]
MFRAAPGAARARVSARPAQGARLLSSFAVITVAILQLHTKFVVSNSGLILPSVISLGSVSSPARVRPPPPPAPPPPIGTFATLSTYVFVTLTIWDTLEANSPPYSTDDRRAPNLNVEEHPLKTTLARVARQWSAVGMATIGYVEFEILKHPPYQPDPASSNFYIFPKSKECLKGQRFQYDEAVVAAVQEFLGAQIGERPPLHGAQSNRSTRSTPRTAWKIRRT